MGSGHVKLLSGCPTWWGLTTLHHHLQSMPLPKEKAWHIFNEASDYDMNKGVAYSLVIELIFPFLLYSPFRIHRLLSILV